MRISFQIYPRCLDIDRKSGARAFFVNQGGDILVAHNDQTRYTGAQYQPYPMPTYAQDKVNGKDSPIAANKHGYDGRP